MPNEDVICLIPWPCVPVMVVPHQSALCHGFLSVHWLHLLGV